MKTWMRCPHCGQIWPPGKGWIIHLNAHLPERVVRAQGVDLPLRCPEQDKKRAKN